LDYAFFFRRRLKIPPDIDKVVMIKGIVIRTSSVIPELKEGYFRCSSCSAVARTAVDRNRIQHPNNCTNCNQKFTMEIIHNRCIYADKQLIRVQELPGTPALVVSNVVMTFGNLSIFFSSFCAQTTSPMDRRHTR
jgi:hypothetical protein